MSNSISLQAAKNKKRIYKCPDCPMKYDNPNFLYDHVKEVHSKLIPDEWTVKQYVFNRKYKKTRGYCVIDKKSTEWNEDKVRYERYCSDRCRQIARKRFKKNAKRKLGVEDPASLPEHQLAAIKGRKTSGEYKFADGGKVGYSSSYEKDFLEFLDEEMEFKSADIEQCEIYFEIELDGKTRFHIPDYYLPSYELLIQIKDGGPNPNMNKFVQQNRIRQQLGDQAIIKDGRYHYAKIVNKDYGEFVNLLQILKNRNISDNINLSERIILLPE